MEFRRLVIGGEVYGCGDTAISRMLRERAGGAASTTCLTAKSPPEWASCGPATENFVAFEQADGAHDWFEALVSDDMTAADRREFVLSMAVNHSVLLDEHGELSASSPDEQVRFAESSLHLMDRVSQIHEALSSRMITGFRCSCRPLRLRIRRAPR